MRTIQLGRQLSMCFCRKKGLQVYFQCAFQFHFTSSRLEECWKLSFTPRTSCRSLYYQDVESSVQLCSFLGVGLLSTSATSWSAAGLKEQESHFKQSWFHLLLLIHRSPLPPDSYAFTGTERCHLARITWGDTVNEGRELPNSHWASWAPLDCWW